MVNPLSLGKDLFDIWDIFVDDTLYVGIDVEVDAVPETSPFLDYATVPAGPYG